MQSVSATLFFATTTDAASWAEKKKKKKGFKHDFKVSLIRAELRNKGFVCLCGEVSFSRIRYALKFTFPVDVKKGDCRDLER